VVGEVLVRDAFYSCQAKYVNENGAILDIPASLPVEISEKVRHLAVVAFKVLNCVGMARADFFDLLSGFSTSFSRSTLCGYRSRRHIEFCSILALGIDHPLRLFRHEDLGYWGVTDVFRPDVVSTRIGFIFKGIQP